MDATRVVALLLVISALVSACTTGDTASPTATPRASDTKTAPNSTAASAERPYRLLTHCGLSYPIKFDGRFWLPTDPELRDTINPPEGFESGGFYDRGVIQRVDEDTVIYTSSTGVEVEYEPTTEVPRGCD
jgi:hypothetical protein